MGHLGNPGAPAVKQAVRDAIATIRACGKPAGLLTADQAFARECLSLGASFVAVGTDVTLFSSATSALAKAFSDRPAEQGVHVDAAVVDVTEAYLPASHAEDTQLA